LDNLAEFYHLVNGADKMITKTLEPRFVVHAGAHRTGTGSFQSFLAQNANHLLDAGVSARFSGRDVEGAGNLRLKLPDGRVFKSKSPIEPHVNAARRALSKGPMEGTVLISEENILGRMIPFFKGKFYTRLWQRADVLRQAIGRGPDQVVLVMRNYGELYVSAYAQLAQSRKLPEFEVALPHLMRIDRGWPVVVEALQKGLQPTRITAVPYADRGTNEALLGQMIANVPKGLVEPVRPTNVSASTEAIAELQRRLHAGEIFTREDADAIKAAHSVDAGGHKFDPLSPAQKSSFTRKYNADLKAMTENTQIEFLMAG